MLVKPLLDLGVLREGIPDLDARRVGRPPIGLSLRSENHFLIGVNLGVSQVLASVWLWTEKSFAAPPTSPVGLDT